MTEETLSLLLAEGPSRWFFIVVAAIFGAVMGSFLNCAAWRIAHGENFLKGRSHCPACGHELGALDLVPVFSWLFLRGKCRYCGEKVSVRYLLTELFFAGATVLCLLRFGLTVLCLRNFIFFCCLFCLSLVDLENSTIPNGALVLAVLVWLVTLPFLWDGVWELANHLLAAVLFGGGLLGLSLLMDRILKRDSLGGGDIKLFGVIGLYLGLLPTLFTVILACIFGLLFAGFRKLKNRREGDQIPFGPSIALAAAVMLLWGDAAVRWYMGLMGI